MGKAKSGFQFSLLDGAMVQAVQGVFEGQSAARQSAHDVASGLYDKGYTPESLMVATDKRPNDAFDKALYLEIVNAVILSPRFGEAGREAIKRKLADVKAANADESTLRRIEMGKVNSVIAQIRAALKTAHENEGETRKPLTLHEVLDDILMRGLTAIQNKGDKSGAPVAELQAAWRDCRAKTNAIFKGATK